ncbi:hypothetical protein NC652_005384 [Populus alba x Populus x berolinensis]|nr:hypothetical protein NC652_005384 [Populus alba x Populus x berolinensis]
MAKTAFVPAASYAKESLESMSNSLGDKMEDAKETSCHGGLGHGFCFGKSSTKRRSRTGTRAAPISSAGPCDIRLR